MDKHKADITKADLEGKIPLHYMMNRLANRKYHLSKDNYKILERPEEIKDQENKLTGWLITLL